MIYPTYVSLRGEAARTNVAARVALIPEDFQSREVGTIVTVLPEVSPDGGQIHLTLTPSLVGPPIWRDASYAVPAGFEGTRDMPAAAQPFFTCLTCNTQVAVADGATVLAGGGTPTQDGKAMVYCFVAARLVGTDGKPLRKPEQSEPVDLCEG